MTLTDIIISIPLWFIGLVLYGVTYDRYRKR